MKPFLVLVVAGLLATACGTSEPAVDSAPGDAGSSSAPPAAAPVAPLPVPVTGPQPEVVPYSNSSELKVKPTPRYDASIEQKLKHALQEDLLRMIRVPGKTSADCPDGITMKASAISHCVVTYEGVEVPYEVKISDNYREGSLVFSYNKVAMKAVLVDKVVYHQFNERFGTESARTDLSKLACEEFPAVKLVEFGENTGLTCHYWSEYGPDGEPGYVTVNVIMGDRGTRLDFEEVR